MKYKVFVDELKKAQSEGYKWVAMDYNYGWFAYMSKPTCKAGVWASSENDNVYLLLGNRIHHAGCEAELSLCKIEDKIKQYEQNESR